MIINIKFLVKNNIFINNDRITKPERERSKHGYIPLKYFQVNHVHL